METVKQLLFIHDKLESSCLSSDASNIHAKDVFGGTSLHFACRGGSLDIVKLLIDKGSNINKKTCLGYTALLAAVSFGHNHIVEFLLNRGVEIQTKDVTGQNVLVYACEGGYKDVVKVLLSRGSHFHEICDDGFNAIDKANLAGKGAETGNVTIIERWSFTMWVLMLQELFIWHYLDADSFCDVWMFYVVKKLVKYEALIFLFQYYNH